MNLPTLENGLANFLRAVFDSAGHANVPVHTALSSEELNALDPTAIVHAEISEHVGETLYQVAVKWFISTPAFGGVKAIHDVLTEALSRALCEDYLNAMKTTVAAASPHQLGGFWRKGSNTFAESGRWITVFETDFSVCADVCETDPVDPVLPDPGTLVPGFVVPVGQFTAAETMSGGRMVHFANGGAVQYADAPLERMANGAIRDAVTAGDLVTVFGDGPLSGLSGITEGEPYYLGEEGRFELTEPSSGILQAVGFGANDTTLNLEIEADPIFLDPS